MSGLRVVVLISGRGSNLRALHERSLAAGPDRWHIAGVLCNRPAAPGLAWATAAGLPARLLEHGAYADRAAFDAALAAAVDAFEPQLVVLAGFMRILTDGFVRRYARRMINVHPSLLPDYRGTDTHRRVLADGRREHGSTVHLVEPALDGGPALARARVAVLADDTAATLEGRVLAAEHLLLPTVVDWIAGGRLDLSPGAPTFDGRALPPSGLDASAPSDGAALVWGPEVVGGPGKERR